MTRADRWPPVEPPMAGDRDGRDDPYDAFEAHRVIARALRAVAPDVDVGDLVGELPLRDEAALAPDGLAALVRRIARDTGIVVVVDDVDVSLDDLARALVAGSRRLRPR